MMRKPPSLCAGFANWRNRLLNSQAARGGERVPKPTHELVLFNAPPRFGVRRGCAVLRFCYTVLRCPHKPD
jgi:hypothetical protein